MKKWGCPVHRSEAVQALRGASALAVVSAHCLDIPGASGSPLLDLAGAAGVSVFFLLSGYLWFVKAVGTSAERLSIESALYGAVKKLRPIIPLHAATLVASLPFLLNSVGIAGAVYGICIAIENLLLLQSWIPVREVYFSCNAVSWYLSTYAFAVTVSPFLLRASRSLSAEGMRVRWAFAGIALCILVEVLLALAAPPDLAHWIVYIFPPVRLLDVFVGMMCGAIFVGALQDKHVPGASIMVVGGGVLMAVFIGLGAFLEEVPAWLYSAAWIVPASLLVVPMFSFGKVATVLSPLVLVGDISLQLFLVHQLVFRYLSHVPVLGGSPIPLFFVSLAVSLAVALLLRHFAMHYSLGRRDE